MKIKQLIDEDFCNYKKPSMFIGANSCTFKCDKEYRKSICQNGALASAPSIEISYNEIVRRFMNNGISESIVIGGLEPFDSFNDLYNLIKCFRNSTNKIIVIYTGYNKAEIINLINKLIIFQNIIIKYGRFIPNQNKHYDDILGVYLASDNQYAERIS